MSALGIGLTACSSASHKSSATVTTGGSGAKESSGGATVTIKNFAFSPDTLRVPPGTNVTVVNRDGVTHTLTSLSGAFNTGDIPAGRTVHFTAPTKPGSYPYRCNIHQFMTGTLVVTSS